MRTLGLSAYTHGSFNSYSELASNVVKDVLSVQTFSSLSNSEFVSDVSVCGPVTKMEQRMIQIIYGQVNSNMQKTNKYLELTMKANSNLSTILKASATVCKRLTLATLLTSQT